MSKEGLESFFKFLAENREFQDKAKSFDGDFDALAVYAQKLGYEFSSEELREYQEKAREMLKANARRKLRRPEVSLSPGARDFYALMKLGETDESVAKRLAELASDTEALIAYGKEKGFIFNERDIQAAGEDILEPSDELSDEELEMAAGGTTVLLFVGILAFGAFALGTAGVAVAVAFAVSKKKG